jgi:hypothetical protein
VRNRSQRLESRCRLVGRKPSFLGSLSGHTPSQQDHPLISKGSRTRRSCRLEQVLLGSGARDRNGLRRPIHRGGPL